VEDEMGDPMKIRAGMAGDKVQVRVLMSHEMENGQRKDASGNIVPPHFIQNVLVQCNGRTVLSAQWGTAMSKNPFLQFQFSGGKKGDQISVTWTDSKGDKRTDESTVV
jgi:sulfur-oxidizing protein SoxZ